MVKGGEGATLLPMRRHMLLCALCAAPAAADVTSPSGRTVDCYCTDATGARVELEQLTCLTVGGRTFLARCAMSLNVPIWRDTGEDCLSG